jgi:hypothetical protein
LKEFQAFIERIKKCTFESENQISNKAREMNLILIVFLDCVFSLVKTSRNPPLDYSRRGILAFLGIDAENLQITNLPTFLDAPFPPM